MIDRDGTAVVVDNVLIDLDKRLDEDSFVQVPGESQSQGHSGQIAKVGPLRQPKSSKQTGPSKQQELSK